MEGSLLDQGLQLMLIGMGTVFMFLTLLVFATKGMSAVAMRLQGAPEVVAISAGNAGGDGEVIAAISGAIALHRRRAKTPSSGPTSNTKLGHHSGDKKN